MKLPSGLSIVTLLSMMVIAAAENSTVIPDWTKWVFFFLGAAILFGIAASMAFCCCPMGCGWRFAILLIVSGLIAIWAYFMFGPWWKELIAKPETPSSAGQM
jgi:hypothetical protein